MFQKFLMFILSLCHHLAHDISKLRNLLPWLITIAHKLVPNAKVQTPWGISPVLHRGARLLQGAVVWGGFLKDVDGTCEKTQRAQGLDREDFGPVNELDGGFLSHGGTLVIIHLNGIFHEINQPASLGYPH